MENQRKKLVLIDGNAIIHRAYHALPPLTTKSGELVNAVYGFASILLKVLNDLKPEYILATFDLAGPTFRHQEYKEYKATRVKAPDELYAQIGRVKEVVRAFNIPVYEKEGYEADDVIGTLVSQSEERKENLENIIVTGDLDTLQLVSGKTKVYALRRGMSDATFYDEAAVRERYGLSPDQMVDFKGLRGDPSDNIPGVKGIGEKTAAELLKKYGTLEKIYENAEAIKGATKEKLLRDKMQSFLSRKLATIRRDVPLKLELEKTAAADFEKEKAVKLFQELNFFSLVKRIPINSPVKKNVIPDPIRGPIDSGSEAGMTSKEVADFKFEIITEEKLDEFLKELEGQEETAIAVETTEGKKYFEKTILGMAFSFKTGRAHYLEWNEKSEKKIKAVLENENIRKIGFDLKLSREILKNRGINLSGIAFDVMLARYVLDPGGKMDFDELVLSELGEEFQSGKKAGGQLGLDLKSREESVRREGRKADYIFKLKKIYRDKIEKVSREQNRENGDLRHIFRNVEMPLIDVLAEMEMNGVRLNKTIFAGISETVDKKVKGLEQKIYELSGTTFNVNSPKQLAEVLFSRMKISSEGIKKNKTGFSTASPELSKIKDRHKIIGKIEEYRELFKLKTTYVDVLPDLADGNSRVHTTFNQAVTATGRLSSSDPNLQNIPVKTDLGQLIRTAFEAEKGWKLVSADYSQIDLRVAAHVSRDKKMIETFLKGEDIHRATAAEINKVPLSEVSQKMRSAAKALNFGIIYGMSVFGFSEGADIPREEAKKFIDEYMKKFSGVAEYMRRMKAFARENGYVETLLGRRRYIPEIHSPNFAVASSAERMAVNMPIQGLAADIMKLAMLEVSRKLADKESVRMILQVHDEIILEARENRAEEVSKKLKEIMEGVYPLSVPLVADVKTGDNWGTI